jgi:hypothetical protein
MKFSSFSLSLVFTLLVFGCGDDSNPTNSCNDSACDDGNPCTVNTCNSQTQSCETEPLSDGASCIVAQTPGECRDGTCFAITCDDVDCDDGNPCTADSCDPIRVVCASAPLADATVCDLDGAPATCEAGICRALTCEDLVCDDGNSCTTDSCDPVDIECASSAVPDQTICAEVGAFGMCDAGICDLSQTAESGTIKLSVDFVGSPDGTAIYEADCEGATLLSGMLIPVDGVWEAFIALPVGMCTLDTILLVDGEVNCRLTTSLDVAAGYGGEISTSASCPQ